MLACVGKGVWCFCDYLTYINCACTNSPSLTKQLLPLVSLGFCSFAYASLDMLFCFCCYFFLFYTDSTGISLITSFPKSPSLFNIHSLLRLLNVFSWLILPFIVLMILTFITSSLRS